MCLVNFETQYRKQNSIEKLKDWLFDIRAFPPFINLIRRSYQVQSKLKVVNMNDQQPYIMIELTLLKKNGGRYGGANEMEEMLDDSNPNSTSIFENDFLI